MTECLGEEEDPKQARKIELFQLTSPHRADRVEEKTDPNEDEVLDFTSEFVVPNETIEERAYHKGTIENRPKSPQS